MFTEAPPTREPLPEFFTPPNGTLGSSETVCSLMWILPTSTIGKTHGLPDVAEDAEREAVVVVTDDPRGLTECQPLATGHDALDFLVSESRVVPSNLSDYSPG